MAEDSLAYWNAAAVKAFGCTLAELQMRNMVGIETPAIGDVMRVVGGGGTPSATSGPDREGYGVEVGSDGLSGLPAGPLHEHTEQ